MPLLILSRAGCPIAFASSQYSPEHDLEQSSARQVRNPSSSQVGGLALWRHRYKACVESTQFLAIPLLRGANIQFKGGVLERIRPMNHAETKGDELHPETTHAGLQCTVITEPTSS
ncbi:hypothetical protein B0H14DRAFT_2634230 [Mycena olivaceomarginata]|nr:hypothetical protein B0H14DRAFT_2634230 [Mycena olivaceomarginata]